MVFQTNVSGIFREDHWYIWHIYLIITFGCLFSKTLEESKNYNVTETQ
jgi:hypothetical protein